MTLFLRRAILVICAVGVILLCLFPPHYVRSNFSRHPGIEHKTAHHLFANKYHVSRRPADEILIGEIRSTEMTGRFFAELVSWLLLCGLAYLLVGTFRRRLVTEHNDGN